MDSLDQDMLAYVRVLETRTANGGGNSIPVLARCYETHGKDVCLEWLENHFGDSMAWAKTDFVKRREAMLERGGIE